MREIKVNEATFQQHAIKLESKSTGSYLPLKNGNMAYSRANSINQLRSLLIDLVGVVEGFQQVTKQDANRLKKMGIAYAKQDQVMGQKINQLEVR
ncbi:TPA_asm: TIGR04197 family type VII secretion effector [Listeria monocytogenes]|nr:TIGR04197 family type VII secretion effector [Listeria monocytogenes]HAA9366594.1 TIGR04197 family type VII secretion effector [Listeria monocytogenes]